MVDKELLKELKKKLDEYHAGERKRRSTPLVITNGMWEDLLDHVQLLQKIIDRSKLADDPSEVK